MEGGVPNGHRSNRGSVLREFQSGGHHEVQNPSAGKGGNAANLVLGKEIDLGQINASFE